MENVRVLGITVSNRLEEASKLQGVLTKYGCHIRTRLGLHEASKESCSRNGLIILELVGEESGWDKFEEELTAIEGVFVKKMDFTL